jgi:hypothetical protein
MRLRRTLVVALLSAGTLAYEILLVRVFAIEHFHHFAYMAIGVAMLGFGVSGTFMALLPESSHRALVRRFSLSSILAAVTMIAAPTLALQVPLDPVQLPWDPAQWFRLAAVYVLLALPFATGAFAVLSALRLERQHPGLVYGASFAGSGLGGAIAIAALWIVMPDRALALPGLLAAAGAATASLGLRKARLGAAATAVLAVVATVVPPWTLSISPYKGLAQVEAFPDANRVAERSSPLGWLVAVQAPAFRHAPGLSLSFQGDVPPQTGLFVDGQVAGAITQTGHTAEIFDWLPTAVPYAVRSAEDVLVLGAGGGLEVLNALAHGAHHITAVELQPDIIDLARELSPIDSLGRSVQWVAGDARSHVARSERTYDLITLAPAGGMGIATAGVHSLQEDFLHTVDAYVSYLRALNPNGKLAITRWLSVPVRESARTVLTATAALRRVAPDMVDSGLVVVRSWGTVSVLVKPSGFELDELQSLSDWTTARHFDLDWYPGLGAPVVRFHHLDEPILFNAATAAVAGAEAAAEFATSYPFDIEPVSDANPYPHHFLRLGSLATFVRSERGAWLPFAEWGQIALIATLAQSVLLAGLLMILPASLRGRKVVRPQWVSLVGYFSAIGFAYLAAEIATIQQLGLLLGHPVYAVAVVLTAFLVCSGIGSAISDRLALARAWLPPSAAAVALAIYAATLLGFSHGLQGAPLLVRGLVAIAVLAPVAFVMGMPFPLGLRALAGQEHAAVGWAWAANGFASVVAAPLAALIALEAGSPFLFVTAGVAYALAAALSRFRAPEHLSPGRSTVVEGTGS